MHSSIDPKSRFTIPKNLYTHFSGVDILHGILAKHHFVLSAEEPPAGSFFESFEITLSGGNHRILIPENTIRHGISLPDYDRSRDGFGLWLQEKVLNGVRFSLFIGVEGKATYESIRDSRNEFYNLMGRQSTLQK